MFYNGKCQLLLYIDLGLCVGINSTRISTLPPKGPYRVGQTVQFSCEVDIKQNFSVTWDVFATVYGHTTRYDRQFNWTFWHDNALHYNLFFCTVVANGTAIDRAKKVIEVQGKAMNFYACVDSIF